MIYKIIALFFIFVPVTVLGAPITYNEPVWSDISSFNPQKRVEITPLNTQIATESVTESVLTAFKFCQAKNHSYISHLIGGTVNPSVVWKNSRWEMAGSKDDFLTIICDDRIIASSSSSTMPIVNVTNNAVDYTQWFQLFTIFFVSLYFIFIVYYVASLVRKFV